MFRIRVASQGWTGGPGLSTYYFLNAEETSEAALAIAGRVRTFYDTIKNQFRSTISFQVLPQVDILDPTNGQVTATHIITDPLLVTGSSVAPNTSPPQVGVLVRWMTDNFEQGRRITGRTFLTQVATTLFDATGAVATSTVNTIRPAGVTLVGSIGVDPRMVVWRRPRAADSTKTPPVQARLGGAFDVHSVIVPTKACTLNSRRD